MLSKIFAYSSVASLALAYHNGPIQIEVDGQQQTFHVVSQDYAANLVTTSGSSLTLKHDARAYIAVQ